MAGTDHQGTGRKKLRYQLTLITLGFGLIKFLIHMGIAGNYELHRDAYLYLDYGNHLQWGYMSNPPFIAVLSWISLKVLGGSIYAVRFFPALAGAITMIMVGRLIKALDGRKWAVILGCTAFLVSPVFLRAGSLFQPTVFDQMFWFMYLYLFVKLLQTYNKNYWFMLGLVAGMAFLNKYTILAPVFLTTLFLLFTRHRKLLWVPQFSGFIINFGLLITPNIIWQYNHNWPELNHFSTLRETQLVNLNDAWFLAMQFLMFAPAALIWVGGLANLFTAKASRPYISLGYSFLGMIAVMLILQAKPYYPAPFYIILFVFGAIQWEVWLEEKIKWLLPVMFATMIATAIPLLPLSLPYLNLKDMYTFSNTWQNRGFEEPFVWEDGMVHSLPQDYADMTGWRQVATIVNEAWMSLPEDQRTKAAIFGGNYGKTGAVNYYNRKEKDFPKAFCFEGSFMFWSPTTLEGVNALIYVGEPDSIVTALFGESTLFKAVADPYFRENGMPVYILRQPVPEMYVRYAELRQSIIAPNHRKPFEHNKD
jgi:hypothetical protein